MIIIRVPDLPVAHADLSDYGLRSKCKARRHWRDDFKATRKRAVIGYRVISAILCVDRNFLCR